MQFVQKQATTKKVLLNPDGSGATLTIGASLSLEQEEDLVVCLRANANMFAWTPSDMTGVPREFIEHHLDVCPTAHPVKQKARRCAPEKQKFFVEEVEKLKKANVVRDIVYTTWVASPVIVPKATGRRQMCVDFTDLNEARPKDQLPTPRIDQIIDSTAGCDLLSFLDAF